MVMPNPERVRLALDHLRDGLQPVCEQTWSGFYGDDWLNVVNNRLNNPDRNPSTSDVAFLFKGMKATWNETFGHHFSPGVRSWVFELTELRNNWAHQNPLSSDDVMRGLDTMERLLGEFGNADQRKAINQLRKDLQRQVFDEETRSERRKTAAKPTEGQPQAGLTPWREVIQPHQDVASGNFDQAEFAADLYEVYVGDAEAEYGDPKAFFARTYLTAGLRDLLIDAATRLSGKGGDPVIELQTNFGGGKTHSMIALYHLASGVPPSELAGVGDALAEAGATLPAGPINRAVLVGQMLSVAAPEPVDDGVLLHTMWGHLAYQLGGKAGYEIVRADDEAGTNPGAKLKTLFEQFGPAVVLIDEWVAYARQLRDGGDGPRLAAGDFDTQFTFAQALTEAAAAAKNVVVLVSIPASDIEVGGDRGKAALEKLKNVVTRKAKQWQPASPDESFEIVRRRLFDPISPEGARTRDGVIRAFCEMYRTQPGQFPSGTTEAEYERRMRLSYPIHPELFDRLFGEWSTLDKFQRTRGVLRLMATAIKHLWQRGDQSLLIMPGTLPMDSGELVSEMKKYLEEGWDPVIKSDVDGENALPLRIDSEFKHFGQISATRRAARTVYMGSAARPDGARGVDVKSVVLGCAQPGESPKQFGDALKHLSGLATHLYVDGQQYWYSLQPNVTRVAADRAASNYSDRDADDLVEERLGKEPLGVFKRHVFAEGPGDVDDTDDGVRLVILTPSVTHQPNDINSSAVALATKILAQREGGPRLNQNLLVFVAATADRLAELRGAARLHLAWKSIVRDHEALDLTAHQLRQAESKVDETSKQVDSLIGETFRLVLTPHREPGTSEIIWNTTRADSTGALTERVTKKLATDEKLIQRYGGVRLRMEIDRYNLWTERHDVAIRDLWKLYAQFPHMPRLASRQVLYDAISDGTSNFAWESETFAYATAHDGIRWVGIQTGSHVSPEPGGLLIHPGFLPPESSTTADGSESDEPVNKHNGLKAADGVPPVAPAETKFYALFDLDPVRGIKQLGDIFEHVAAHLGPNITLSLELRAENPEGYTDATRRVVSENTTNLGGKPEFE
jgi:hypothetical protein